MSVYDTLKNSVKMLGAGVASGIFIDKVISPILDRSTEGISNQSAQKVAKIGVSVIDLGLFGVFYSKSSDFVGDFSAGVGVLSFMTGIILTTPKSQVRFRTAVMSTEMYISGLLSGSGHAVVGASSNPTDSRYNTATQGNYPSTIVKPVDNAGTGSPTMDTVSSSRIIKSQRPV